MPPREAWWFIRAKRPDLDRNSAENQKWDRLYRLAFDDEDI